MDGSIGIQRNFCLWHSLRWSWTGTRRIGENEIDVQVGQDLIEKPLFNIYGRLWN